jgi:predicted outer membrane protein
MKLRQKFSALAPALVVLTLAAGTAYAQDSASKPGDNPTRSAQAAGQDAKVNADTPVRSGEKRASTAASPTALTDGQILQIVRTLNDAEIKQANEAMDEGKSDEVKRVAEMIKTDHEKNNEELDELLKGDRNLEDSPMNDMLSKQAEDTHEALQNLSGNEYDCAYLQAQADQHQMAIDTAKSQLTPNAKSADVGKFLSTTAPALEHHLQMAKDSLGKVEGCAKPAATTTTPAQPQR